MPATCIIGDKAAVKLDSHGCPMCPHPCVGPAISGSPNVKVNELPVVRLGDVGIHAACCGSNIWVAAEGSATVFVNGNPVVRKGDRTHHCGSSVGQMIEGSANVCIGGPGVTYRRSAQTSGGDSSPVMPMLGAAAFVSQLDTPVPGPADVVAGGIAVVAGGIALVNAVGGDDEGSDNRDSTDSIYDPDLTPPRTVPRRSQGGGKTGRKSNPDRSREAERKIEELQKQKIQARTKREKGDIQRQIDHWRRQKKKSEPHARKGQKGKRC